MPLADPIDKHPVGSPEWWAYRLDSQLDARQSQIERLDAYYRGDHPLPHIPERAKYRETYRRLLRSSRSNWMKLVIDVALERLAVQGFAWPAVEDGSDALEAASWEVWEANDLEVGAEQIHQEALLHGCAYALVDPNGGDPIVTPEHPGQAIVATDPGRRRERVAGWKRWMADDGHLHACLYLPDRVIKLRSRSRVQAGARVEWEPRGAEDEWEITNPFGVVPLVPFVNQPRMLKPYGVSDIDDLTDTQDRINETIFSRLVGAQFSAFRQRYVTGLPIQYDEDGKPKKPFEPGASELWQTGSGEASFGEFSQTDLAPYIASVEADIQHLAAQSRTPPHYLLGQSGAFPSGESLKSTETGLVAKIGERQVWFTPAHREVNRLALLARGIEAPRRPSILWKDPEARTLGELTDALLKMAQLGVPRVVLWARWGATPREIAEWEVLATQEALELAALQPDLPVEQVTAEAA